VCSSDLAANNACNGSRELGRIRGSSPVWAGEASNSRKQQRNRFVRLLLQHPRRFPQRIEPAAMAART